MTRAPSDIPLDFVPFAPGIAPLTAAQLLLVPGQNVPVMSLDLPDRLMGHAREQVARRQVEMQLDLSGEHLEVRPMALGKAMGKTSAVWRRALVVDRADLASWRRSAGAARAILPDYMALPAAVDLWCLRVTEDHLLTRLGLEDGFTAELALAAELLKAALRDHPPKGAFVQEGLPDGLATLFEAADVPVYTTLEQLDAAGLARPQVLQNGELTLDLRRDPFRARQNLQGLIRAWVWPLGLLLLGAGLWAGEQIFETRRLTQATEAVRADMLADVRAHFLPNVPILDVRLQVSQALAAKRAAAGDAGGHRIAIDLLGQASEVLFQEKSQVDELFYRAEGHQLLIQSRVSDFSAAERLVSALQAAGLQVETSNTSTGEGDLSVRMELRVSLSGQGGGQNE